MLITNGKKQTTTAQPVITFANKQVMKQTRNNPVHQGCRTVNSLPKLFAKTRPSPLVLTALHKATPAPEIRHYYITDDKEFTKITKSHLRKHILWKPENGYLRHFHSFCKI